MLGRWEPWHDGHQALFKRCFAKTGKVMIQVRDFHGVLGGDGQDDNPFNFEDVKDGIIKGLSEEGYTNGIDYNI